MADVQPKLGVPEDMLELKLDPQQSRFEKSLGLLTTRFVSLLQSAPDGILHLKVVSFSSTILLPEFASGEPLVPIVASSVTCLQQSLFKQCLALVTCPNLCK